MSEKIIELYFNRDLVLQLGNISKNIVADYDVNIIAPNIYNEINILLDSLRRNYIEMDYAITILNKEGKGRSNQEHPIQQHPFPLQIHL